MRMNELVLSYIFKIKKNVYINYTLTFYVQSFGESWTSSSPFKLPLIKTFQSNQTFQSKLPLHCILTALMLILPTKNNVGTKIVQAGENRIKLLLFENILIFFLFCVYLWTNTWKNNTIFISFKFTHKINKKIVYRLT